MIVSIFLDTNILIYSYDRVNQEKHKISVDLISQLILKEGEDIVISSQVVNEFIVVITGKVKYPLSIDEVERILKRLQENFKIKTLKLDCEKAISIFKKYKFSYWDSLIVASAIHANCSTLYTEDIQDEQIVEGKLRVVNPFKIIES